MTATGFTGCQTPETCALYGCGCPTPVRQDARLAVTTMDSAHADGRHGTLPHRDPWFTANCPRCAAERAGLTREVCVYCKDTLDLRYLQPADPGPGWACRSVSACSRRRASVRHH